MHSLLPDLVCARGLMSSAKVLQLVQDSHSHLSCSNCARICRAVNFFQVADRSRQLWTGNDRVEMIVEDHPCINLEALVFAAESERADKNFATGDSGEDRQPFDDCRGDEVGGVRVIDAIAAAHEASVWWETEFPGRLRYKN